MGVSLTASSQMPVTVTVAGLIDLKNVKPAGIVLAYAAASGDMTLHSAKSVVFAELHFQTATLGAGSFHVTTAGGGGTLLTIG